MFREMRRKKQILSEAECEAVLNRGSSGVLALLGDEGYPYAVPLSYVYTDGKLYFHSAVSGHKTDAVKNYGKASFCVIDQDQVLPEKYTTCYRSVIAFGQVRIIGDPEEMQRAAAMLGKKYYPGDSAEHLNEEIEKYSGRFCMLELCIEHMTGKEGAELLKNRGVKDGAENEKNL